MIANWTATEAIGNAWREHPPWAKLGISCVLAPILSVAAYGFGWFTALPTMAAGAIPVAGGLGYGSAAFAGLVAALVTSGAHGLVKTASGVGGPPAVPPGGGA